MPHLDRHGLVKGGALRAVLTLAAGLLGAWCVAGMFFTVDVTQFALVTRFGRIVHIVREPGLHLKAPVDRVTRLDKRTTLLRPPSAEYLTVDKKNIVAESLVTWRIADPERYFAALGTRTLTNERITDLVLGETGAVLGTHPSVALIAPVENALHFSEIVGEIRSRVAHFARQSYGIEVLDVQFLRLALPEQNRVSVFERMKAERGKMAKEYRTMGELHARKIIAEADREKGRIEAEAYEQAQRIKAEGDAEATQIYSAAFSRNPAFYKFQRTLQAYEKFLDENTTLFLPAGAEVLRVLTPEAGRGASQGSHRLETERHAPRDPATATKGSPRRGTAMTSGHFDASEKQNERIGN
jgi:modulator of FtsH protease HflC